MGVHGITTFLQERNLLPTPHENEGCYCASITLWKEWKSSMAFKATTLPLQFLPPGAKLFIDGNGLAFFLYRVAYARQLQSSHLSGGSNGRSRCPSLKTLGANQAEEATAQALPSFLPLESLHQVALEFATTLQQLDYELQCYWDGPTTSTFKANTLKQRKKQRENAWASLQTYCQNGTVPLKPNDPICQCFDHFPLGRLFSLVVRQALESCRIPMVDCSDEADVELARAATGNLNAYVLGQDSDYLFYKDIQYIPLQGGLYLRMPASANAFGMPTTGSTGSGSGMYAVCWTRRALADTLGLDDEDDDDMVTLAMLLGNDYVNPETLDLPSKLLRRLDVEDRIAFLLAQPEGFRVQPKQKGKDAPELDFVRRLYNLQDMDAVLPLTVAENKTENNDGGDSFPQDHDKFEVESSILVPEDFPLDQAVLQPTDTSIQTAIVRCLQTYMNQCAASTSTNGRCALRQEHLDAYQACTMGSMPAALFRSKAGRNRRPRWTNVRAAFLIDLCISRVLRSSQESSSRITQPPIHSLINHERFHAILSTLQREGELEEDDDVSDDVENVTVATPSPSIPAVIERPFLPIDEHEETILDTIQANRVTIIHGETGCGKSSRVPVVILDAPSPEPTLPKVKLFISQPRRIAAASLVERVRSCEPEHGEKFAVRMGHGYREYESSKTQAWFVTTGYLTRLLANHPERFDDVTHLIIDEVHERSVDTDILCLLCRRLLEQNETIRLVLMSATMATKLYQEYFQVPFDPIHVGVRRFPIQEFFVEDLACTFQLPPNEVQATKAIEKECNTKRCKTAPTQVELSKRFSLAARLVTIVGVPGSSVLIFVPGMNEIISIDEAIAKLYRVGITYRCYPIHSDVPFEEQMEAFEAPGPDEVKVIIATNAAESSVTLPAVDHVICLGLCRQIMYNQASHRQILLPCWISKASATQRAGRTGRLGPGNVYRLYTRQAYEQYMDEFEQGEMVRIPLDSVILMLKEMLHEEVKPVLMDCIEQPKMATIDKSFESLFHRNFISKPNDSAEITRLGAFVAALGIDLALGSYIGLGIQFGVGAEAIEMAAVMSFPRSPFQIANPLFHDPAKYNEIASRTYVSRCHFDAKLYSEPLALMNALWDYHVTPAKDRWCAFYRFAHARMSQLHSTRKSLRKRTADFLGINEDKLQVTTPPVHMPQYKLELLRALKVWVFSHTVVECPPTKLPVSSDGTVAIKVPKRKNNMISKAMLDQVLKEERHPYRILEESQTDVQFQNETFSLTGGIETIQCRLVSYMCEEGIDAAMLKDADHTFIYLRNDGMNAKPALSSLFEFGELSVLQAEFDPNLKRRGILERKCGLWKVDQLSGGVPISEGNASNGRSFYRIYHTNSGFDLESLLSHALQNGEISSIVGLTFLEKKKKKKEKQSAQLVKISSKGMCTPIGDGDLRDILSVPSVETSSSKTLKGQSIIFLSCEPQPLSMHGKGRDLMATGVESKFSSWRRPLIHDIPEGARLVSVLASGQRKDGHRLCFPDTTSTDPDAVVDVLLEKDETKIGSRWKRLGTKNQVYVQEDTVPASATSVKFPLIACCANALDLKGGAMKVEGMTLLPPNPLFLLLCRLSFGLGPVMDATFGSVVTADGSDPELLETAALQWLKKRTKMADTAQYFPLDEDEASRKIRAAIAFHAACADMGESLVCFPDKTRDLCDLLSGLDGYEATTLPDTFEDEAMTPEKLLEWQKERKAIIRSPSSPSNRDARPSLRILRLFDQSTQEISLRLFAKEWSVSTVSCYSTNILALVFAKLAEMVQRECDNSKRRSKVQPENFEVGLMNSNCWVIMVQEDELGERAYQARFDNAAVPLRKVIGTGGRLLPKWMRKHPRPQTIEDAKACVPPPSSVASWPEPKLGVPSKNNKNHPVLVFESIEAALQMEAAFYLERQCAVVKKDGTRRHWFEHGFDETAQSLFNICKDHCIDDAN